MTQGGPAKKPGTLNNLIMYRNNYDEDEFYEDDYYDDNSYEREEHYERYNGSYAQDVEEWSDELIDEVFDGDPDAYWNID